MDDFGKIFGDMFNGSTFTNTQEEDDKAPIDLGANSSELVSKVYTLLRTQVNVKLQPTKKGNYAITYKGEVIDTVNGDSNEAKIEFINYCLDS